MPCRLLLIVPAADRAAANAAVAEHLDEHGSNTFRIGLSPNGEEPATHFWCSGLFNQIQVKAVLPMVSVFRYSEPGFPHAKLVELGLQIIQSET